MDKPKSQLPGGGMHPYVPELQDLHRQGRINRREFLRLATLLGVSVASAEVLAGCTQPPAPAAPVKEAPQATQAPKPTGAAAAAIKRGGELRVSTAVYKLTDPAAGSWTEYNVWWFVAEYLAVTGLDNITRPWLLEKWEASADLKTWTLYCRKGIKFNHGPEFTADDVIFNIKRWLDPATKSSMLGLMGTYLSPNDVEKVDQYTVKLNLKKPQIAVPEHLFHNPAAILSKDFQGDWVKQPVGTGPFTLAEYVVNERALVKRREGYWRNGADGKALPYLDSIRMVYLGTDPAPAVAALQGGDIDVMFLNPPLLEALEKSQNIKISHQVSSFTHVIRMRADKKPFDDARVRNAIKLCQDREKILQATQRGYGALGEDHHVAPIHPEYTPGMAVKRDIEKAKALLKDAGHPNGLTVKLSTMDSEPVPTIAQLLKEQCAPAGINIELAMMPANMYWDQWMDVDFGITSWTHRALAVMTLGLAYRTGVPWNETHWSNKEFDTLLDQAEGTLDIEARKKLVARIQKLMQDEGPVAIPRWNAQILGHNKKVQNLGVAPHDHLMAYEAWIA
ncbi:MAG: ABC transporter substrate-binding protein [Chloroflexi bacterium]|nr:ABC transporter substrate-binding protein [Chloroflexota bacterium]